MATELVDDGLELRYSLHCSPLRYGGGVAEAGGIEPPTTKAQVREKTRSKSQRDHLVANAVAKELRIAPSGGGCATGTVPPTLRPPQANNSRSLLRNGSSQSFCHQGFPEFVLGGRWSSSTLRPLPLASSCVERNR